jgi:hypothetical protein
MSEDDSMILQLPDDLFVHMLLFTTVKDIVHFSYCHKHMYHSIMENDYLWRELCRNYLIQRTTTTTDEEQLSNGNTNWRDEYKRYTTSNRFDTLCCNRCRTLLYSNFNRSVESETHGYLSTTRSEKPLYPGGKYHWTFTLDKFTRDAHGTWWMMLGIEDIKFPFQNQTSTDVIGYQSKHGGVALVVGICKVTHSGQTFPVYNLIEFKQGDCIGVILNMMQSTGSIEFYHIQQSQSTLIFEKDIPSKKYYPAVSLYQNMKVTIGCWPSKCDIPGKSKQKQKCTIQ